MGKFKLKSLVSLNVIIPLTVSSYDVNIDRWISSTFIPNAAEGCWKNRAGMDGVDKLEQNPRLKSSASGSSTSAEASSIFVSTLKV